MNQTSYLLHYAPDNASLVIRLALEEAGVTYQTCLVDRRIAGQRTADYLKLNPTGLIPVLETADGPIFETAAILLWLADQHEGLAPAPTSPGRADFLTWLFFLSNTLHPALRMLFYTSKYIGEDPAAQHDLTRKTQSSVLCHLSLLNSRWADGSIPLALTLYLAPMLRWLALYPRDRNKSWFDLSAFPALHQAAQALEIRASTHSAQRAEGLGPSPFTAPSAPTPPEGSAT